MANVKELEPESDAIYRLNIWFYKLTDSIWNPRRRLKKIPLIEPVLSGEILPLHFVQGQNDRESEGLPQNDERHRIQNNRNERLEVKVTKGASGMLRAGN